MTVDWSWVGACTPTSARLVARLASGDDAELLVSTSSDLSSPTTFGPEAADSDGFVSFALTGLTAGTTYYYGIEVDTVLDESSVGKFRTFPTEGPQNLTIVHGSCLHHTFDGPTWAAIAARDPDILVLAGDLHYSDINDNDEAQFIAAYNSVMTKPLWLAMHRALPSAYVWDDHDFCGDASDGTASNKAAAQGAYRRAVPHYPLPDTEGIWQSFVLGRVRVVMLDTRSYRSPNADTDNASKTMLGAAQKTWLKSELLAAKAAGQVVALVSSQSWHASGSDGWRLYTTERAELASFITDNDIDVFILSGDVHAVAMDDGTNTVGGIPEFMAAPLQQFATGVSNNGTWSHGARLTNGIEHPNTARQYGLTEITDDGELMTVTWSAYNVSDEGDETLLTSLSFTFGDWLPAVVKVWDGSAWQPVEVKVYDGADWAPAEPRVLA